MALTDITNFYNALNAPVNKAVETLDRDVKLAAMGQELWRGLQAAASDPDSDLFLTPEAKMAMAYDGADGNFQQKALLGGLLGAHAPSNFFAKPESYSETGVTQNGIKVTDNYLRNPYTTFKKQLGQEISYEQFNELKKAAMAHDAALYPEMMKLAVELMKQAGTAVNETNARYQDSMLSKGGGNGILKDMMLDPIQGLYISNPLKAVGYSNTLQQQDYVPDVQLFMDLYNGLIKGGNLETLSQFYTDELAAQQLRDYLDLKNQESSSPTKAPRGKAAARDAYTHTIKSSIEAEKSKKNIEGLKTIKSDLEKKIDYVSRALQDATQRKDPNIIDHAEDLGSYKDLINEIDDFIDTYNKNNSQPGDISFLNNTLTDALMSQLGRKRGNVFDLSINPRNAYGRTV